MHKKFRGLQAAASATRGTVLLKIPPLIAQRGVKKTVLRPLKKSFFMCHSENLNSDPALRVINLTLTQFIIGLSAG
jgi:hypothetical protein